MAHVIVLGNEKGGSGKSTTAMHVIAALMRSGHKVGALDLDLRQKSLFRYLENRADFIRRKQVDLPMPRRIELHLSNKDSQQEAQVEEETWFGQALKSLDENCSLIVIDCPGAHSWYSQMAHAVADTLMTPLNDSLVDFDMLARVDSGSGKILGPTVYSEMVWKARQMRTKQGLKPLDWVVLRNRMSTLDARNKRYVGSALKDLAKRIDFRIVPGFCERVIFRELFLSGLTLLDLRDSGEQLQTMSNVAARNEVRDMIRELHLPNVEIKF